MTSDDLLYWLKIFFGALAASGLLVLFWWLMFDAIDRHMELYQECGYSYCPMEDPPQ